MDTNTNRTNRGVALLAVFGAVLALATVLAISVGCAPKEADDAPKPTDQGQPSATSAMDGQPVDWTMESDCSLCHTVEAEGAADPACPQAKAHEAQVCGDCHTMESELSNAHADVKFGDKAPTKATAVTVDPQSCIDCHGSMEEMAAITASSTALTDSNGVTVNPHERPEGSKHDEHPATCTDCHNNHSRDLPKDAMKYCAQCHHRGVFQCGTCHELRDR